MKVQVTKTLRRVVELKVVGDVLYVTANCFVSQAKLKRIISSNADWVKNQQQKQQGQTQTVATLTEAKQPSVADYSSCDDRQLACQIFAGRKTMVLGDIVDVASASTAKTHMENNTLFVSEKCYPDRDLRLKAIKSYLKKVCNLYVANEIATFGASVALCPAKIEFRDIADSWLKCSVAPQKILCLDFRIAQLPLELRRYVIAHAFAHFVAPLHDATFQNTLADFLPGHRALQQRLCSYDFLKDI